MFFVTILAGMVSLYKNINTVDASTFLRRITRNVLHSSSLFYGNRCGAPNDS